MARAGQMGVDQPPQPLRIRRLEAPQRRGQIRPIRLRKRPQKFDGHVHRGLADHLALLVAENLSQGKVGVVKMRGLAHRHDLVRIHGGAEKIGADRRLEEAVVVGAEVAGKVQVARDRRAQAVEHAVQAARYRPGHVGGRERELLPPVRVRIAGDRLDRPVRGAAQARIGLQLCQDTQQRVGPVEDDVGVDQADDAGLPRRKFVHEPVPGVVPAGRGDVLDPQPQSAGASGPRSTAAKISAATATVRSVHPLARQITSQA